MPLQVLIILTIMKIMREIKFRAWDKDNNEWIYSNPMPDMGFWKWVSYDSTTIFNQFTGLTDKNGNEIYEGDIVSNEIIKGNVAFIGAMFVVYDKNSDYILLAKCGLPSLEIIGNIHEKPELF